MQLVFGKWRLKRSGKQGKGLVTKAKKRGGERGPEGSRTTVHYDITVRAKYEDGSEHERDFTLGNVFTGTSLSAAAGDQVPIRYDASDNSNFIVDEHAMKNEQKAWLERMKREEEEFDQERVAEVEDDLPPNP